ncbi:hypothetical protein BBO99_00003800 [Phytophthora kernoviae]|uniref:RanBD1 domain-containing protein n=1 Tax=Phytophthora kernoviae TaxID=325452 RepID=A0A421GTI1_9STRA|nr:hypothetical protein BBI17_003800 [Phytophthora kernoviae]RLN81368.1 hypothetical protein BBO99_00003800 [Phytophthora kernoviae]
MAKRRNENGQMRREEYEAADDQVTSDSFEIGFQRASEDSIRKRKIVKARVGSRPPVAAKPKAAAGDDAAKSNPFGGFQPTSANPFSGFSGLTSSSTPPTAATTSSSTVSMSGSYQDAMEGLNKEFLAFVNGQAQKNPSVSWVAAVQDYLKYADGIATKHASTKPVAINEQSKRAAPVPFSFASMNASAPAQDGDEENIGREEATVIIKADSPDDDCTFDVEKAKIFEFKKDEKRWADKGVHPLKVLVSKETKSARILVRNEIGKIVLNSALYEGLAVHPQEAKGKKTGVTLALQVESGELTQFLIKVNAARVDEFIKALESAAVEVQPPVTPDSRSPFQVTIAQADMGAKKQQTEATEPTSPQKGDFLKLFWTLAESDRAVRTQAAAQILAHLQQSSKADAEVQYTLKRLVRGLASSRDAARQGFSTALAGLLATFPKQVTLKEAHELLRDAMEVHSSMKPMEQREHMFGRLFGLLALHRSGRLSADLPLLVTVVKELLEMANFKRWFRETCYEAALTLLADVPAELFLNELATPVHACLKIQPSKGSEEDGVAVWNADQVLLAVGVQRYMHVTGIDQNEEQKEQLPDNFSALDVLHRHNVHLLMQPMRGSSSCYPRVHSAWFGVFGHVLNPTDASAALDGELFQETWTVLVENSLVGGSKSADGTPGAPTSHERQGLALKIFELVAPKLPVSVLRAILTPRFVKCLYNNAVAKRNYLHEAARHCLKAFAACVPAEFFHFFRKQFASPLSILVTGTDDNDDEDEENNEQPKKKQKLSAGGFDALIELEEQKERDEALQRRTDRARVWALEAMIAAITEQLSNKNEVNADATKLQDEMLQFLVFHAFFTPADGAESTPSKKSKKNKKAKKTKKSTIDEVAQQAAEATPELSENVSSYAKTRLFSLMSLGLAGADGACASDSVLGRIFAIAQDVQSNSSVAVLREALDEASTTQLTALISHIDTLRNQEGSDVDTETKSKKSATRRPLGEAFLLLFMSAGLQILDGEQREDAAVVAADLDKCYAQLLVQEKTPTKKKSKKNKKKDSEPEEDSVVVLTDLLLSLLSQDSSALREIVTQAFRSLLPLLNGACLTTMVNVLQSSSEGEGTAANDEDDEFAPITSREDDEDEEDEEEEEEVMLSSSDAVSEALRKDAKLSALHQEDLALAAIVGQVKVRSQRKKDVKRARVQTMHFQLRVLDLLQVFVSQSLEESEDAAAKHSTLVLSLVAPLFLVLTRVQKSDSQKRVLRDRLQVVLLHKVLRSKDKISATKAAQNEALDALRQVMEVVRTTPLEKEHAGKVASAAVVYLVRVLCSSEASIEEEVQQLMREAVLDSFTKKHSRFPRASFEELLTKFPAVGARVLLAPLVAVAAASEKKTDDESEVRAAIDDFSQCEVFRLLTVLLRGSSKLQQSGDLTKAQRSAFTNVQKSLKTAIVRQLTSENVKQLKPKRMKVVMTFALQLVKFWHASENKKTTESDVRAVVEAVQAVETNSPVVKGMAKQVAEAVGMPVVTSNGVKPAKSTKATEDEDELMPEQDEEEVVAEEKKVKAKKSKTKSPKDKQKKKRKRSVAEE